MPLVVGLGEGENFLASNAAAFLRETRTVQFPGDGEIVAITPDGATFSTADGEVVQHDTVELDWDDEGAEKGGYETFMLKEIHEQPEAVAETIGDRVRHGRLVLEGLGMSDEELKQLKRIVLVACGTAYHACVVGRYIIEEWHGSRSNSTSRASGSTESSRRRAHARHRHLAVGRNARHGRRRETRPRPRRPDRGDHEHDGLAGHARGRLGPVHAGRHRDGRRGVEDVHGAGGAALPRRHEAGAGAGTLPPGEIEFILDYVYKLPRKVQAFLDGDHPIEEIAQRYHDAHFFLYLGRHIGLPVALEGALKLKEISYIPTEAYSAGEMKHGPIALLDEQTPVVVVATNIHVYDKIVSNIQEVRARGAHVIAIATDGNEDIQHHADDVIYVPKTPAFLQVVLAILPLQLLAYRIARLRGLNVDQPRNLAKTVTVEWRSTAWDPRERPNGARDGEGADPRRGRRRGPGDDVHQVPALRGRPRAVRLGADDEADQARRPRFRGRLRHVRREARPWLPRRCRLRRRRALRVCGDRDPGREGAGVHPRRSGRQADRRALLRREARGDALPRSAGTRRARAAPRQALVGLPAARSDIQQAGAEYVDGAAVVDGNMVSCRGWGDLPTGRGRSSSLDRAAVPA